MGLDDVLKKKVDRRKFLKKSFGIGAGLAISGSSVLFNIACPPNNHNNNNNNDGIEYRILTTWKADYALEGTEATGKVKYYQGGTYNPDENIGTLVKEANLGEQVELGTAKDNNTVSFDVVVEAVGGLRKVYKNVAMSKTKTYYDEPDTTIGKGGGILKLEGFNLDDYIHKFLDPHGENIRTINRWKQDGIEAEFNPDISAISESGLELFTMTDFMPSKDELKIGMTYEQALERGKYNARNSLKQRGRKFVVLYDGDDFDNREALIKWGTYLKNNISEVKEVKDLHQAQHEGLDKLKAQGYEILQLNAKRLSDDFINEIIKWLKHVKELSGGVIKDYSEVKLGNRTAADLANIPAKASWSFYDSKHKGASSGVYPVGSQGPIDAHDMRYNEPTVDYSMLEKEVRDAFFRGDQDYWPANVDDWIRFSFMRPETGYEIHENYEVRNGIADNVSVQGGIGDPVYVKVNKQHIPKDAIRAIRGIRDKDDYIVNKHIVNPNELPSHVRMELQRLKDIEIQKYRNQINPRK